MTEITKEQANAAASNDQLFEDAGITKSVFIKSIKNRRARIKENIRKKDLESLDISDKCKVLEQGRKEDDFLANVMGWKAAEKHEVGGPGGKPLIVEVVKFGDENTE